MLMRLHPHIHTSTHPPIHTCAHPHIYPFTHPRIHAFTHPHIHTSTMYLSTRNIVFQDVKLTHLPPQTVSFSNELVEDSARHCYPHADALATCLVQAPQAAMVERIIAQYLANFCDSNLQYQPVRSHGIHFRVQERSHQRLQIVTIPKFATIASLKSHVLNSGEVTRHVCSTFTAYCD